MPSVEEASPSPQAPRPVQDEEAGDRRHSDTGPNRKKRIRHWTADDRKVHSIFEKERRDDFRKRLLSLADLLPSLAGCKAQTISKHMVVDESIKHIAAQNERFSEALNHIQALIQERDDLISEVNQWHNRVGLAPKQSTTVADDFVRQWSSSESLPPVAAAESGGPANQQQGLDSFDGGQDLSLTTTFPDVAAIGESTSHNSSDAVITMLPATVPLVALPGDGLTEVDVQAATAPVPSDQVEHYQELRVPPGLCRSDATIQGLQLGTTPPESHLLIPAQPQMSAQPRAPEVGAYILNTMSSDFGLHNVLPHFSQPSYNLNNNYAVPHSLGDERNLNGEMALWEF